MTRSFAGFLWRSDSQHGQMIVLTAAMLTALLMFVGLAVDAGNLYSARRTMQEAADAASYAGAVVLYQGGTQAQARAAAVNDATRNGYTDDTLTGGTTAVTISAPPVSGPKIGNNLYVEVVIASKVRTALVPAQSVLNDVRVRGVAGAEPLNNNYAIMSLDRGNTPSAFAASPNADIHLTGGGVLVNSTNATAVSNSQSNPCRFTVLPNPPNSITIAGGQTGLPTTACATPASPPLTVATAQPQQPDPFAGFPRPSLPACAVSTPTTCLYSSTPAGTTLDPGVYTSVITAAGTITYIMDPGVYILKAGLNAAGLANFISATATTTPACNLPTDCGVFIFNTHSNYPNAFRPGIDTCGGITFSGNATSNLKAMTMDPVYKNFLVYQDPNCTNAMTISGNGSFTGSGTIYLPGAAFGFNGNNATLNGSQLVAQTVNIQNGNITIDFNAGTTAQPTLPRLFE